MIKNKELFCGKFGSTAAWFWPVLSNGAAKRGRS